jgi:hypothetical protein
MTDPDSWKRRLLQALATLRPYLPHIIIIGGWVPALYREYGGLHWRGRLSFTQELDVLATPPIPVEEGGSIEDALRAAGYEPSSSDGPSAHWINHATGSEIEFLTAATGPERSLGARGAIPAHGAVATIQLADLEILREFRSVLKVPVRSDRDEPDAIELAVPTLGAYVINKALTFPKRLSIGTGPNPKQAKDLLYLRDVTCGGDGVTAAVKADLEQIVATGRTNVFRVERARSNLLLTCQGGLASVSLRLAADMLAERERLEADAALADLRGYLLDLESLISGVLADGA